MLCFILPRAYKYHFNIKTSGIHDTDVSVIGALFADIPLVKSRHFFSTPENDSKKYING